jgi:quinolinate synthase
MSEIIAQEIRALLKKRKAILLAHNYQRRKFKILPTSPETLWI